jgi:hypothetical protein
MFRGRFGVPQPERLGRRLVHCASLWGGLFHQIKVRQQIGREDSIQTVRMRRVEGFLYEATKNFELF